MSRALLFAGLACALVGSACEVSLSDTAKYACVTDADCASADMKCTLLADQSGHFCCTPAAEVCDGEDNDCDGVVDNVPPEPCYGGPEGTAGVAACKAGTRACKNGKFGDCEGEILPSTERCNHLDDDCNGQTDEGFDLVNDAFNCGACNFVCSGTTCHNGLCGNLTEKCFDGVDNDLDGLADCNDPDCKTQFCKPSPSRFTCDATQKCTCNGVASPAPESACGNGLDDDCDSALDCADSDCANQACGAGCVCAGGVRTETVCDNGLDDDADMGADCADTNCAGKVCSAVGGKTCDGNKQCSCNGVASPGPETACTDGADDDCDGQVDCADADCNTKSCGAGCACGGGKKTETTCNDGQDNDGDGASDCGDTDCAGASCGTGCACNPPGKKETVCNDGADNDGDGSADCADADCLAVKCRTASASTFTCDASKACSCNGVATPAAESACSDGQDSDCDGLVDCADSDCGGASCGTGCTCLNLTKKETACNDGLDNDGDAKTDCVDTSDCLSAACTYFQGSQQRTGSCQPDGTCK